MMSMFPGPDDPHDKMHFAWPEELQKEPEKPSGGVIVWTLLGGLVTVLLLWWML
jgi:hypothetical protein